MEKEQLQCQRFLIFELTKEILNLNMDNYSDEKPSEIQLF